MATHSIILAWRISTDRRAWQDTVHGVAKSWTLRLVATKHSSYIIWGWFYPETWNCGYRGPKMRLAHLLIWGFSQQVL